MGKSKQNKLARALSKAHRSGAHVDSVLGINNPNSRMERIVQNMPPPKLSELARHLEIVAIIPETA